MIKGPQRISYVVRMLIIANIVSENAEPDLVVHTQHEKLVKC